MQKVKSTDSSRSWFCVWNNPKEHLPEKFTPNMTPEEVVDTAVAMWVDEKPSRSCAVSYEIGDTGNHHLHMVLEDPTKTRFSAVRKLYPGIHCDPTRGTKKQAMDYIYKRPPFAEKNHTIVVPPVIHGEIVAKKGIRVSVLDDIEHMIEQGMTPNEIMDLSIQYREKETLIRKAYFAKRSKETPPIRDVLVRYHIGSSRTGKTYTYVSLCEEVGEDQVYCVSDHSENGAFDKYCGEPYIFIDELRYMKYEILLQITQGYKTQVHCRYDNAMALWTHVDITSILPPEELYKNIVPPDRRSSDSFEQFLKRIHTIVFHYKENGEYKTFELPGSEYHNYSELKSKVFGDKNGFVPVGKLPADEQLKLPFNGKN